MESKTYICESNKNSPVYYDIDDNGIVYRPDNKENISFLWKDIEYIEDRERNRVVLSLYNSTEIAIHYTTNDFSAFLTTICSKLSEIRRDDFRPQKFTLNFRYIVQLGVVVLLLFLSLIISLPISKTIFFALVSLVIPLVIFFHRQPISITIETNGLVFLYLFKEVYVDYSEIVNIDFVVINNDYGRILSIVMGMKNRNNIIIKKTGDIIVLFIILQTILNEKLKSY